MTAGGVPKELVDWFAPLEDPDRCWVSKNCYLPRTLLDGKILPALKELAPTLEVFYNTVVTGVSLNETAPSQILSLQAVQRTPLGLENNGYDSVSLSRDMPDWYSPVDSPRFAKSLLQFVPPEAQPNILVVDASELGDVLALASAQLAYIGRPGAKAGKGYSWIQGTEKYDGSLEAEDEVCGQSIVFPFVVEFETSPTNETLISPEPVDHPDYYDLEGFTWDEVWTYRRLVGTKPFEAEPQDASLQNWGRGNDYPFGYLFPTREEALQEALGRWQGGVNYQTLEGAERHAVGWHYHYKRAMRSRDARQLALNYETLGSLTGLSKFPYLRDTRRSIGIDNFFLRLSDIRGPGSQLTGTRFRDRVALGSYAVDIHPTDCKVPDYMRVPTETLPFYLPFRSLTNRNFGNLLVGGKTMAQSFMANSASRVHPVEFSSGIAAGAAAAFMVRQSLSSTRECLSRISELQAAIKKYAPIDWTIEEMVFPLPGETLPPIPSSPLCPANSWWDSGFGFCLNQTHVFGPFPAAMSAKCEALFPSEACRELNDVIIHDRVVSVPVWKRSVFQECRGDGPCPEGTLLSFENLGFCVEEGEERREGTGREGLAFGMFGEELALRCLLETPYSEDVCFVLAWPLSLLLSLVHQ